MANLNRLESIFEKGKFIMKETVCDFLSLDDKGTVIRNVLGAILVMLPEIPTYFIPAYSEAKATGDAKNIKEGEGPRGLLTGALEGLAVGAINSKREPLKVGKLFPYVLLGAGIQFISSKVFPVVGENFGRSIYKKNHPISKPCEKTIQNPIELTTCTPVSQDRFKGASMYATVKPGNLKI